MEERLCLRDHAVHHREEYLPASWRVATCQIYQANCEVNKNIETYVVGGVRVIIHATKERR